MVESVFAPAEHRLIYETAADLGEGPSIAGGWTRGAARMGTSLVRPGGTGLAAALGCVEARRRLSQDHWVGLVSEDRRWHAAVEAHAAQVARIDGRFLLIAPAERASSDAARDADATLRTLRSTGWNVCDLAGLPTSRDLAAVLVAARAGQAPSLILVDLESVTAGIPTADEFAPPAGVEIAGDRNGQIEIIAETLRRQMAQNFRLTPILTTHGPVWDQLARDYPQQSMQMTSSRIADALPWCGGLAQAGCHPVLVLDARDLAAQRPAIAREVWRRDLRITIITIEERRGRGARAPSPPPEMESRILAINPSREVINDAMAACFAAAWPMLLYIPLSRSRLAGRRRPAAPARPSPSVIVAPLSAPTPAAPVEQPSILQGLPGGAGVAEMDLVAARTFSPEFETWVGAYEQVGHRGRFLWKWCLHGLEATTLSSVADEHRAHLCDTKLLAVMYGVLLDDVADRDRDNQFLKQLMSASTRRELRDPPELTPRQRAYAEFTWRLWDAYDERLRTYPRHGEYAQLLSYDNDQVLNTMQYSFLVNANLQMMNLVEHDLYSPHNMQMMTFATTDLMASPAFDAAELGVLRQAIWHAQCMGRIGNLISTWEREIDDRDFSSGVFAHLIDSGVLTVADLAAGNADRIRTAVTGGSIERRFLDRWAEHRRGLKAMVPQVRSVDLGQLLAGLDRLIRMELDSRGLK